MIAALRPVTVLTAATLLAFPVFAQGKPQSGQPGVSGEKQAARDKTKAELLQEQGEGDVAADGMIDGGKVDPDQLKARNVVHGARGHCRFDLAVQPARLAPGQSGVLKLTMILEGDSVLLAPANLKPLFAAEQGPLALGSFAVRPAAPGKLAPAYKGQPVYDNYAIVEIPVTMRTDAKLGATYPVNVAFEFDLQNGTRGQPLGTFSEQSRVNVECGVAPTPVVAMPAAAGGSPNATATGAAPAAAVPPRDTAPAAASSGASMGASGALQGVTPTLAPPGNAVAPVPSQDATSPGAPGPVVDGGNHLLLTASAAGALLVVLAVMLVRRR